MPKTQTTHEWLNHLLRHKQESIERAHDEIRDLERSMDTISDLLPFASCAECGAELLRGDWEELEDVRAWARRFGKQSMLCVWCDHQKVALFQLKEFNRIMAWAGEAKATQSAARIWERIFGD